jgi:hypothetical protein
MYGVGGASSTTSHPLLVVFFGYHGPIAARSLYLASSRSLVISKLVAWLMVHPLCLPRFFLHTVVLMSRLWRLLCYSISLPLVVVDDGLSRSYGCFAFVLLWWIVVVFLLCRQ